jgi:hypothetical protein
VYQHVLHRKVRMRKNINDFSRDTELKKTGQFPQGETVRLFCAASLVGPVFKS